MTTLRTFPFPPGWPHLQNPIRHLDSYRLSDHGRWSVIAPVLLRVWLQDGHLEPLCKRAVHGIFGVRMRSIESRSKFLPDTFIASAMIAMVFAAIARTDMRLIQQFKSESVSTYGIRHCRKSERLSKLNEPAALASIANSQSRVAIYGRTGSRSGEVSDSRGATFFPPSRAIMTMSDHTSVEPSRSGRNALKSNIFRRDQERPNVHVGLHYLDGAYEYSLKYNCNVLSGEDLHR